MATGPGYALEVLLFATLAVPRLKRLPPAELARRLAGTPIAHGAPLPRAAAEALALRIDRLLRSAWPLVRPGCLTRCITIFRFLRQAGADVVLCFGLTRALEGGVNRDGHCWLTCAGEPLAERRDPRPLYVETFRVPAAPGPAQPPA